MNLIYWTIAFSLISLIEVDASDCSIYSISRNAKKLYKIDNESQKIVREIDLDDFSARVVYFQKENLLIVPFSNQITLYDADSLTYFGSISNFRGVGKVKVSNENIWIQHTGGLTKIALDDEVFLKETIEIDDPICDYIIDTVNNNVIVLIDRPFRVAYVDIATNEVTGVKSIPQLMTGDCPVQIIIHHERKKAYAINQNEGKLFILDLETWDLEMELVFASPSAPYSMGFNRDQTLLYIGNDANDNVYVIDTFDDSVVDNIIVGYGGAIFSISNDKLISASYAFNSIRVFDLGTKELEYEVKVGDLPLDVTGFVCKNENSTIENIPTLSQWGYMVLSLLFVIICSIGLRQGRFVEKVGL